MITVIISAKDSGDLSHNFVRMSIQYHESCDDWTRRARRDIKLSQISATVRTANSEKRR